jgi:GT2 family glycosyltransferase
MIEVITATLPERRALFADCAQSIAAQTLAPAGWHVGFDHDRQGPAKVLNGLAQRVQTEWLFRLDDDDLLEADHFEVIKPFLKNNTADIVYTWCAVEGRMARNRFAVPFDATRLQTDNFIPSCAAIRTTLFHELGGYKHDDHLDTTRHEDWDFWLRALESGARFLCIPIATWTYRMGDWQHRSV